jgi:hypothetical protein
VELRGLEPLTPCLQSLATMSSTVHGLVRSFVRVRLSAVRSKLVGVGYGCHEVGLALAPSASWPGILRARNHSQTVIAS